MTAISDYHRGICVRRVQADMLHGNFGWSNDYLEGAWLVGNNPDRVMTWNEALAWIDEVADEPAEEGRYDGPPFFCEYCGDRELLHYMEEMRKEMEERRLCFNCNFWHQFRLDATAKPKRNFVAEGSGYSVGAEDPGDKSRWRGFGGSKFVIKWLDGVEKTSHNLWYRGIVPDRWRNRLPDTARFVRP